MGQARPGLQESTRSGTVMGLNQCCHFGESPVSIRIGLPGTMLTGCKSWLSVAQAWGVGCRQEDTGHSTGWWLKEGTVGPWGCCVGGEACLHFPCVEVTPQKLKVLPCGSAASLGNFPAALRLSPPLSLIPLSISPGEEQSTLTQLEKKRKQKESKSFAPARLKIGVFSSLRRGNSQLPTEELVLAGSAGDQTVPGCSAAACPEVLSQFPMPECTEQPGRGSGHQEGLLL